MASDLFLWLLSWFWSFNVFYCATQKHGAFCLACAARRLQIFCFTLFYVSILPWCHARCLPVANWRGLLDRPKKLGRGRRMFAHFLPLFAHLTRRAARDELVARLQKAWGAHPRPFDMVKQSVRFALWRHTSWLSQPPQRSAKQNNVRVKTGQASYTIALYKLLTSLDALLDRVNWIH